MPAILVTAGIFVTGYLAAAVNHKGWAVEGLAMRHSTEVLFLSANKLYFITVLFMEAVVALGDKIFYLCF